MSRTLRIVAYAVNGSGVGHLTRLHAIARWIRRYALLLGVRPEIWFLTSCEADGILFADRFPSFKLPSKTVVGESGHDKLVYLGLAKQWVWHSLTLLRPDLLVVDTFPRGAFGELLSALDLCRKKAFVYRPTKASFAARADFQAMIPLYDLVVVPEHEEQAQVQVPDAARGRLRFVGPIVSRDAVELLDRDAARAELGITTMGGDRLAVLVSAGGGGDPNAERHLERVHAALAGDERVHLVLAAGPLYRGRPIRGPRVTWIESPALAARMRAFDLAICAAGYNTFHELMLAGVPTLFVPQPKVADEQDRRADRAIAAGAAATLDLSSDEAIRAAVERFRDPDARARASAAGRALVPTSHARDAAAELLRLVVPAHEVDAVEELLDDEVLRRAEDFELFATVARALAGSELPNARDRDAALDLSERLRAVPREQALRIVEILCRKLGASPPRERAIAIGTVIEALAPFADWSGAAIVVGMLQSERQLAAPDVARRFATWLGEVRAAGHDLYRAIADLSRASAHADAPGNDALLRAATEERPS